MKSLKCIVVGADYSECSDNALKEANRIAIDHDAKLVCLHVFEKEIMDDFKDYYSMANNEILNQASVNLKNHVASVLGSNQAEFKVVIGHPFKEILREVAESNADMLVLGSRGHRQTNSRRTGVFAAKCIRKAPVEVLLVRAHQDGPFRSVVACIDFSDTSEIAARRAADIANQDGASLELFHAFATPLTSHGSSFGPGAFMTPMDTEPMMNNCKKRLDSWIDKVVCKDHPNLQITTTVKEGISAGNTLIDHLHQSEADLAVLGTQGRTGLQELLLGTTAERLIHEAPCSTLAIKPEGYHYQLQ